MLRAIKMYEHTIEICKFSSLTLWISS